MPIGLLGKKLGHTRVYNANGILVPVTAVLCGPNRVLQIRTREKDGYCAVQLGFGDQKPQRIAKPVLGHLARCGALTAVATIKEFRDFPTHLPAPPPKQDSAEKKEREAKKEEQKPEMKEVKTG